MTSRKLRTVLRLGVCVFSCANFLNCGSGNTTPPIGNPPQQPGSPAPIPTPDSGGGQQPGSMNVTVSILAGAATRTDDAFGTNPLAVASGTTVMWTNQDTVPHTVTSSDSPPEFSSPVLSPGQSFMFTFARKGDFPYVCQIHPNMKGMVRVS